MGNRDTTTHSKHPKTTHGYYAALGTDYDPVALEEVHQQLEAEFSPQSYIARFMINQLAIDIVRLGRLQRFDADAIKEELNPPTYSDPLSHDPFTCKTVIDEGAKSPLTEAYLKKVDPIHSRHESAILNRILRIFDVIRATQP